MIIIREIQKEEYNTAKHTLENEGISDDYSTGIIYGLINGERIQGVGNIITVDERGILKYLIVAKKYRGLNLGEVF